MFWRKKSLISEDLKDWIFENYAWAISQNPHWDKTPLVLPSKEFFRAPGGDGHDVAMAVLDDIKRIMGIEDQNLKLHRENVLPDGYGHEYGKLSDVAGTYIYDPENPEISYDPRLLRQPMAFIGTLAHEVMHHILADVVDDLPGGEGAHELATDLHVIMAGFGVIQIAGAAQTGWMGYMTQESRAFALTVFLRLTGAS